LQHLKGTSTEQLINDLCSGKVKVDQPRNKRHNNEAEGKENTNSQQKTMKSE